MCSNVGNMVFLSTVLDSGLELKDYCILHLAIQPKGKLPSEKIVLV